MRPHRAYEPLKSIQSATMRACALFTIEHFTLYPFSLFVSLLLLCFDNCHKPEAMPETPHHAPTMKRIKILPDQLGRYIDVGELASILGSLITRMLQLHKIVTLSDASNIDYEAITSATMPETRQFSLRHRAIEQEMNMHVPARSRIIGRLLKPKSTSKCRLPSFTHRKLAI
jgi:hypothetical protein